jgi:hypothetical protein
MSSTTSTAEVASNRRTAIYDHALVVLAETDADGEVVKTTVLRELYRQQPTVSLEDVLELNMVVAVPEPGPLAERVDAVLSEAVAQHDSWTDTPQAPPASENTSIPATEEH